MCMINAGSDYCVRWQQWFSSQWYHLHGIVGLEVYPWSKASRWKNQFLDNSFVG